MIGKMWKIK